MSAPNNIVPDVIQQEAAEANDAGVIQRVAAGGSNNANNIIASLQGQDVGAMVIMFQNINIDNQAQELMAERERRDRERRDHERRDRERRDRERLPGEHLMRNGVMSMTMAERGRRG